MRQKKGVNGEGTNPGVPNNRGRGSRGNVVIIEQSQLFRDGKFDHDVQ